MEHKLSKVKGYSRPNRFPNQNYDLEQDTTELNPAESILIMNSSSIDCYFRSNQHNNFTIKKNSKRSYYKFNVIENIKKEVIYQYYTRFQISYNIVYLILLIKRC